MEICHQRSKLSYPKKYYVIFHSITGVLGEYTPMYRSFTYFIWTKVTKDEEFKIIFDKRDLKDENCPSDELLKDVDARLNVKRRLLNPKKNDNKPTALMFFDGTKRLWKFNRGVDGVDKAPKTWKIDKDVYFKCQDLKKSKSKKVTWLLNNEVKEFEIEDGHNMRPNNAQTPNNPRTAEEKAAKKWRKMAQGKPPPLPPREGKPPLLPPKKPPPLPPRKDGNVFQLIIF